MHEQPHTHTHTHTHPAFVLRALTKLLFSVALANLTELLRPSLGLDPMSGLPRAFAARAIFPGAPPAAARSDIPSVTPSGFRAVSATRANAEGKLP